MRCYCCNRNLSDFESVLRHPVTNEFLDMCKKCLKDIPIVPVEPATIEDNIGYEDEDFLVEEADDDEVY